MGTQIVTASVTGPTAPIGLDTLKWENGQGYGLISTVSSGATTEYTVEVTGDDIRYGTPTHWNPLDTNLTQATTSQNSNIAFPVTAIRLNVIILSGGTVALSVISTDA